MGFRDVITVVEHFSVRALFYYRYGICYVLDNNRRQVIFLRADILYKILFERMHIQ
jgi:hypothetical protein